MRRGGPTGVRLPANVYWSSGHRGRGLAGVAQAVVGSMVGRCAATEWCVGMGTATVIMNVCEDVSEPDGRGGHDSPASRGVRHVRRRQR